METGKIIVSKSIEQPKVSHRSWIKTASGGLEGYSEKSEEEREKERERGVEREKEKGKAVDAPDGPFMDEVSFVSSLMPSFSRRIILTQERTPHRS
jgi:hypothetical protein